MTTDELLMRATQLSSRISGLFPQDNRLHTARFATPHELHPLLSPSLDGTHLLLGEGSFHHVLRVSPTKTRRELGNALVVAPTRGGKGLLATAQLLTWPHSVIVNDIKGELFTQTAGFRARLGKVFVIDPTGFGHRFDPLAGRGTERQLYASAKNLLYEPQEGDGRAFTERATKMLTQLFRAAREENRRIGTERYRLLPYVGKLVNLPLKWVAARLQAISPQLAMKFLDTEFAPQKNLEENKYLTSAWDSLTARLYPLLADEILPCFDGSDFTAGELMTSKRPITVYLRWPEAELLALSPLVRLVWESLMHDLITTFDRLQGHQCQPVLLLLDKAGRTGIHKLYDHATTVAGRGISLWIAIQDLSQLDGLYGRYHADTLRNNCESQLYYRQASHETAQKLEERLGRRSEFAHSSTEHDGVETSQGQVEQAVALMTAQAITQLADQEIIGFHRSLHPFRAKRMDWQAFPVLVRRRAIPPPPLPRLSGVVEELGEIAKPKPPPIPSWHFDPELFRRRRPGPPQSNGLGK
jgi:type IV secretion system protein VirD4